MPLQPSKTALPFGDSEVADDESKKGLFLRWSRVKKTVVIQGTYDSRLSFGAPTIDLGQTNSAKKGNTKKVILSEVSGFAAPGEVLAMMGYVLSFFSQE